MYIYMICMNSINSMYVQLLILYFLYVQISKGGCLKFVELFNLYSKLLKYILEIFFFRGSGGWGRKSEIILQEKLLYVFRYVVLYVYLFMFKII